MEANCPRDNGAGMRLSLCVMALCGTALHQIRAQDSLPPKNHLNDRFQLNISGAQVWLGPRVKIDGGSGTPGTDVDGKDVGASNSTLEPRLALRWRPGGRHELDVGYQFARRSGGRVLADTIYVADTSFAGGLRIESVFKADQAFLNYHFAFRVRERSQIGAAVGVGVLFFTPTSTPFPAPPPAAPTRPSCRTPCRRASTSPRCPWACTGGGAPETAGTSRVMHGP